MDPVEEQISVGDFVLVSIASMSPDKYFGLVTGKTPNGGLKIAKSQSQVSSFACPYQSTFVFCCDKIQQEAHSTLYRKSKFAGMYTNDGDRYFVTVANEGDQCSVVHYY